MRYLHQKILNMNFGFLFLDDGVVEISPSLFDFASKEECRKIFIAQYNACVQKDLQIKPVRVLEYENLYELFYSKIVELINDTNLPTCKLSEYIIDSFINQKFIDLKTLHVNLPLNPAAKLIQMIYAKDEIGLTFNASMLFSNYIYDKIYRLHRDKSVTFEDGLIIIKKDNNEILGIMPSFKYVKMSKPHEMDNEIKIAFDILKRRNIEKVYIAFPKNEEFKKHIIVKQDENDESSRLTLVPYAITHKIACNSMKKTSKQGEK